MAKPKVRREFLGAFKRGHRPSSKEFIDEELALKLLDLAEAGDKEAELALLWLARFNNEFHKDLIRKDDPAALHNTERLRKDCHRRNYMRRHDLFTAADRIDVETETIDGSKEPVEDLFVPLRTKKLKK